MSARRAVVALLALVVAAACGDDGGVAPGDGARLPDADGPRVDAALDAPPPACDPPCPLGVACTAGGCVPGDLTIDRARVRPEVVARWFDSASCEIGEGCVDGPGARTLLRFDLETPNLGPGDVFLGTPTEGDLFTFGECHGHFHFQGYAAYRLLDAGGAEAAHGRKMAFCLLDTSRRSDDAAPFSRYTCSFQGISAGWSDSYTKDLPCQWVDVTDVAPGAYTLEVTVNPEGTLAETDVTNNVVTVPVTVPENTCPGGCEPVDPACCGETDTCGRAGDGVCNCGGLAAWDAADCASCLAPEVYCHPITTCPRGCTPAGPGCVVTVADGRCDCGGAPADDFDCSRCRSVDADCPQATTCPLGLAPPVGGDPCCRNLTGADTCFHADDGRCDCGGLARWDANDCAYCY